MISPVSSQKTNLPSFKNSIPMPFPNSSSSLCSLQTPVNLFYNILSSIFSYLKSLLCCGTNSISLEGEDIPEVSPTRLSKNDPFRKSVFSVNLDFRDREAFLKTSELFKILGTKSYSYWVAYALSIYRMESQVIALKTPPTTFLYYLLLNQTKTSYLHHFKRQSPFGWRQFTSRLAKDFISQPDTLTLLPGFCQALSLDYSKAKPFVDQSNWEEFISWVFNQRKNHFNLK